MNFFGPFQPEREVKVYKSCKCSNTFYVIQMFGFVFWQTICALIFFPLKKNHNFYVTIKSHQIKCNEIRKIVFSKFAIAVLVCSLVFM